VSLEPSPQIVLRAEVNELDRLSRWIASLSELHHLPARVAFQLDLCLSELVTNVISYAYPGTPRPVDAVAVRFTRRGSEVVVEIVDRGVAFDPSAYVPAPLPKSLEEGGVGGRGLRLVRQYAGALHYQRDGEFNRLELVFPLPGG
jgi:serine/threonine-protein kinase RsbW